VLPIVQRSFLTCDDALAQAGMTASQMDAVLLVGGMTHYPLVKEAVFQYFGQESQAGVNPDEVVALGAAIQAHNLTAASPEMSSAILLDVTPQSLGVKTAGGFCEILVPRNSQIPTATKKVFHTATDDQVEVRIEVYQGESRMVSGNELLGQFVLEGLRPAMRGDVKLAIEFDIDADGIVHVRAQDLDSGLARSIHIEASSGLTEEEVQKMGFEQLGF
jgi:molecular chaperone DnaK